MVLQNYQNFILLTSNMIYIVALGVGFKCPRKIHLNTQWGGGGASCTTRLFEGEGFDSIPSKILARWQLATCPSAPYPRLLAPGPSYFRRPYIAKKNLLSFPLLLSICLNLLCSRLMNPSSRQETHWNIFKRFFCYSLLQKKMLVIVTSRQTFGLIFKFWSHLPQNSEFLTASLSRRF